MDILTRIGCALVHAQNAVWEVGLGVRTHGRYNSKESTKLATDPADYREHEYGTIAYRDIFRILDFLELTPSDVFVDLGSGKGRVLCAASLYPVGHVIGIEDAGELCEMARNNLRQIRGARDRVSVINTSALFWDYRQGTVLYLYNPFYPRSLRVVLRQIRKGLNTDPRPLRIVHVYPRYDSVLEATDWLKRDSYWPSGRISIDVSFWSARL